MPNELEDFQHFTEIKKVFQTNRKKEQLVTSQETKFQYFWLNGDTKESMCQFQQHFTSGYFITKVVHTFFLNLQFMFVLFW